jgi:hypothetical protein
MTSNDGISTVSSTTSPLLTSPLTSPSSTSPSSISLATSQVYQSDADYFDSIIFTKFYKFFKKTTTTTTTNTKQNESHILLSLSYDKIISYCNDAHPPKPGIVFKAFRYTLTNTTY